MRYAGTVLATAGIALAIACGPGGFDGLTGGTRDAGADATDAAPGPDDALKAPRQIGPLSVQWVNTLRPELKWKIEGDLTGAVVEMCTTRACDTVAKTFTAPGSGLVVPEDLAAGIWFWRLRGIAPGRIGTAPGPTWEFLARGPGPGGESKIPAGSIADVNGDGIPDLQLLFAQGPDLTLELQLGTADGDFAFAARYFAGDALPSLVVPPAIATIDVTGDGFPDTVVASIIPAGDAGAPYPFGMFTGGPTGLKMASFAPDVFYAPDLGRTLSAVGDFDGDGHGDVAVGASGAALVLLGGERWSGALVPLSGFVPSGQGGRIVLGGFDWDGDGYADALTSIQDPKNNVVVVHGGPKREYDFVLADLFGEPLRMLGGAATLDFDGDGKSDLALSTVFTGPCADLPGGEKVTACGGWCAYRQGDLRYKYCGDLSSTTGAIKEYGAQMLGADLTGEGKDSLLIAMLRDTSIVEATLLPKDDTDIDETKELVAARGFGGGFALLWPGHPGKARWAGMADKRGSVRVFEGEAKRVDIAVAAIGIR